MSAAASRWSARCSRTASSTSFICSSTRLPGGPVRGCSPRMPRPASCRSRRVSPTTTASYTWPTERRPDTAPRRIEMGRIVVTELVSLDGVMEAPGGGDVKYMGWSFEFARGEDGDKFKLDETLETDVLLIGRVTYESFANAWPNREGPFADKFNSMPKYVVSSKL